MQRAFLWLEFLEERGPLGLVEEVALFFFEGAAGDGAAGERDGFDSFWGKVEVEGVGEEGGGGGEGGLEGGFGGGRGEDGEGVAAEGEGGTEGVGGEGLGEEEVGGARSRRWARGRGRAGALRRLAQRRIFPRDIAGARWGLGGDVFQGGFVGFFGAARMFTASLTVAKPPPSRRWAGHTRSRGEGGWLRGGAEAVALIPVRLGVRRFEGAEALALLAVLIS